MTTACKVPPRTDFVDRRQGRRNARFHKSEATQEHGGSCKAVEACAVNLKSDRLGLSLLIAMVT